MWLMLTSVIDRLGRMMHVRVSEREGARSLKAAHPLVTVQGSTVSPPALYPFTSNLTSEEQSQRL
jgi:hypothetical protein